MKVVILAGGRGSRLSEETAIRPKPMVEIGGKPMLWHILNTYSAHGFNEFVIALGYKGEVIKEYFLNFFALNNDITINLRTGQTTIFDGNQPPWTVHLCDTGINSETGGRIQRLKGRLTRTFMLTYGDGVADINLSELLAFHRSHGKLATVTTVRPPSRFGGVVFEGDRVVEFTEKPQAEGGWINGGFFVLEPGIFEYLRDGDATVWERDPLEQLARDGELMAYRHYGFWQPMDTLREKLLLEDLWNSGTAPWSPGHVRTSTDGLVPH